MFIHNCVYICVRISMHVCHHLCRGQRTTMRVVPSFYHVGSVRIQLSLSSLVTSVSPVVHIFPPSLIKHHYFSFYYLSHSACIKNSLIFVHSFLLPILRIDSTSFRVDLLQHAQLAKDFSFSLKPLPWQFPLFFLSP